jgi:hypothetical protein
VHRPPRALLVHGERGPPRTSLRCQRAREANPSSERLVAARVTVRLGGLVCLGSLQAWLSPCRVCSSGDWPPCACLGSEPSTRVRRRRSGARCWLDQKPVRRLGVTHYRPAAAVSLSDRHHRCPTNRSRRIGRMLADQSGLRGRRRHPPRRARAGAGGSACGGRRGREGGSSERARLPRGAPFRGAICGGQARLGDRGQRQLRRRSRPLPRGAGRNGARAQPYPASRASAARQGRRTRRGPHGAGGTRQRDAGAAASGSAARGAAVAAGRSSQRRRRPP